MKFAKVGEEVFSRQSELSGEEYRLYSIIVFHTWGDSGVCKKTLGEISEAYDIPYNHLTERYKKLRQKGWCENTKKGVRPLVFANTPENGVFEDENSKNRSNELQKSELETPENGVLEGEKLQKSELYIRNIEPFKDQSFPDTAAEEKTAAAAADSNGHQSKFSIKECLRYAEICVERGEPIKNPHGLAMTAYQTGTHDVFIQARLYPEQNENAVPIETGGGGEQISEKRREALAILTDMKAEGEDISTMEKWYEDDWAWLQEQLETG